MKYAFFNGIVFVSNVAVVDSTIFLLLRAKNVKLCFNLKKIIFLPLALKLRHCRARQILQNNKKILLLTCICFYPVSRGFVVNRVLGKGSLSRMNTKLLSVQEVLAQHI